VNSTWWDPIGLADLSYIDYESGTTCSLINCSNENIIFARHLLFFWIGFARHFVLFLFFVCLLSFPQSLSFVCYFKTDLLVYCVFFFYLSSLSQHAFCSGLLLFEFRSCVFHINKSIVSIQNVSAEIGVLLFFCWEGFLFLLILIIYCSFFFFVNII
jgi:hypothetical protein